MSKSADRQALLHRSETGVMHYPGQVSNSIPVTTADTQICDDEEAFFHSLITACEKYFFIELTFTILCTLPFDILHLLVSSPFIPYYQGIPSLVLRDFFRDSLRN